MATFRHFFAAFVLFSLVFSGCSALEKREFVLEGANGKVPVRAEIARTDEQRERGYMFRKKVNDGEGMLFIFDRDEILSFWMKNTLVSLSIAYISSEGKIVEIHDLEPGNLNPVRSSRSVRYALEVPRGWFTRTGLGPGDRLDISGL